MIALWTSSHPLARGARVALEPLSWVYGVAAGARATAYRRRWLPRHPLPLPALGIGSSQVGGAGKTPIAAWAAFEFLRRRITPAILLRGYGGDEGPMLRAAVPGAVVVEDPDRGRGATTALGLGAHVLVLDDNAQHLAVVPRRQLLLLNAEALASGRRLLPAGPWREPLGKGRADLIVLTRKDASPSTVAAAMADIRRAYAGHPIATARLGIAGWRPLSGGSTLADPALSGRRLFACCGIADPGPFLRHVERLACLQGHRVFRDHARYGPSRVSQLARAAESARVDYVVTTAKDAVKLRGRWPADAPPVLVADLAVAWESGVELVTAVLEDCLPDHDRDRDDPPWTHAAAPMAAGMA